MLMGKANQYQNLLRRYCAERQRFVYAASGDRGLEKRLIGSFIGRTEPRPRGISNLPSFSIRASQVKSWGCDV